MDGPLARSSTLAFSPAWCSLTDWNQCRESNAGYCERGSNGVSFYIAELCLRGLMLIYWSKQKEFSFKCGLLTGRKRTTFQMYLKSKLYMYMYICM